MTERFAVYYAPDITTELWRRASAWLGRDAAAGINVTQPVFENVNHDDFFDMTATPRRYGFHATLKPPMHLAAGVGTQRLWSTARAVTASLSPATIGPLEAGLIDGFLALLPTHQSESVTRLAAECVSGFEPMRAPLFPEDRTRRMQADLTETQLQLLDQYGYPYVMDQFRMHMTLTGRLDEEKQERYLWAAQNWFAPVLNENWRLDTISIYRQPAPGEPFERIEDFPFCEDA